LRDHFAQYGQVVRVLVAQRKIKGLQGQPKTRPGSLGLVVMKRPGSVRKIMAMGEDLTVCGQKIRIERFEPSKLSDGISTDESTIADSSMPSHYLSDSQRLSSSDSGGGVDRWSRKSSVNDKSIPAAQAFVPVPGSPLF